MSTNNTSSAAAAPASPTAPIQAIPDRTAGEDGPKQNPSWRLVVALLVGGPLWLGPFLGGMTVLLPARLEMIAPDQKVGLLALLSGLGAIVAFVANILFGALSDLTRSRLGRRAPLMIFGSITAAGLMFLMSIVTDLTALIVVWTAFTFFLNAIVATIVAIIPDRVPHARRGTYSAVYGAGILFGATAGGVVAAGFVQNPAAGFTVLAFAVLLAGPLVALIAPDRSNRDLPRPELSLRTTLSSLAFPRRGARDFYLALSGKLLIVLATFMIVGYQVYIATDYIKLDLVAAGGLIATMSLCQLALAFVFGFIAGPISDKLGRRKAPIMFGAFLIAAAALVPFFWNSPMAMIIFAAVGLGIGSGIFGAVDQALNYEVLPNQDAAAKDLGILNMANGGGQILGPIIMSVIVGVSGGFGAGFLAAAVISVAGAFVISRIRGAR